MKPAPASPRRENREVHGSSLKWIRGRLVLEVPALIRIPLELEVITRRAEDEIKLTRREGEVLKGVLLCQSNKEIASGINLSERTVKFHVSSLLLKFGVKGRGDLISRLGGTRSRADLAAD